MHRTPLQEMPLDNVSCLKSMWYSSQAFLYTSAMFFERGSFQSEHAVCLKRDSLLFKQTLVHFTYAGFKGNNETNTHFRKQHVHHVPLRKQYSCKQSPVVSTNTFSFKLFIPCTILKTLKKHVMKWLKLYVCQFANYTVYIYKYIIYQYIQRRRVSLCFSQQYEFNDRTSLTFQICRLPWKNEVVPQRTWFRKMQ